MFQNQNANVESRGLKSETESLEAQKFQYDDFFKNNYSFFYQEKQIPLDGYIFNWLQKMGLWRYLGCL